MKWIIIPSLVITVISFFNFSSYSIAEEVVLCFSHADQYVVTVNEKEDCIESEVWVVLSGSGIESKKSMAPVANFAEDEECEGEGYKAEIGFDENDNGSLDKSEIISTTGTCMPLIAEDQETDESEEE